MKSLKSGLWLTVQLIELDLAISGASSLKSVGINTGQHTILEALAGVGVGTTGEKGRIMEE